jgi:hypothetical protein
MWSRLCAGVSHSDGSFFLLCVSVCGPVYALVYSTVKVILPVVCACMWSRLGASVSHSDGSSFLLCLSVCSLVYALEYPIVKGLLPVVCVCIRSRLCASVSHSDWSFFPLSVCGPFCALLCPAVTGRSSCCVSCLCASVFHNERSFFLLCCVHMVPPVRYRILQRRVVLLAFYVL